jgi:UDP-N-acetylmuramate--alanine ligase
MTSMQDIQRVYMVGIGGIGMSALAQLFLHQGARVSGSDRSLSPTTEMLKNRGIEVLIGQSASHVPEDAQILIYSDAVPHDHEERVRGRELGIPELSYFEALGRVAEGKRVVAISGTHGKTTTTAMLGKILIDTGCDPTVIVGSIVSEWGSNFRAGNSDLFVVEACEYRKHFLVFNPEVLVITNIEWDHTDFFKTADEFVAAFEEVKKKAKVVIDVSFYGKESVPELLVPGEFNKDNARAAKAAARAVAPHISDTAIDTALASFRGTWRRFEFKGKTAHGAEVYDDYAHHPTEMKRTLEAAREKFPNKKLVVFFHPHLYSRTRDLFAGFVSALAAADRVYILPVFAAREAFDPSVSNEALAEAINKKGGHAAAVADMEETAKKITELGSDTVAFTMGAGDVYKAGEMALKK